MNKEGTIILQNGEEREIFLRNLDPEKQGCGTELFELSDGRLLVTGASKWVTKDYRNFELFEYEPENFGGNYMRLKDGRVMSIFSKTVDNIYGNHLKAADFYCSFSDDECRSFHDVTPISTDHERLYLMNNRIKRLSNGRIALCISLHPNCLLEDTRYFEAAGWITMFYSDDEGKTWQKGEWLTAEHVDQLCEPTLCEMPDGHLKMLARTGRGYLYQTDSYDGGITWSPERPTTLRSAVSPYNFHYDPFSKRYLVCWNDSFPGIPHQEPRTPIRVAVSDDGENWEPIFTLGNNPLSGYGYPAFHFTKDEIHITYYINPTPGKGWGNARTHFAAIPRDVHEKLMARD